MKKEKTYFLDRKKNIRKIIHVFYVLCAAVAGADFIIHRHVTHGWEKIPLFYALFGFVACVVLVLLATQMRRVLMRGEDYYEKGGDKDA